MNNSDSDVSERPDEHSDLQDDPQEEINHLHRMLDDAAARIMRLCGTADQVTDAEIEKRIQSLQDAVQWWINDLEQDLREQSRDFSQLFQNGLRHSPPSQSLDDIGLSQKGHSLDAEWIRWLGGLNTCIYVVLGRQIWTYLHREIFSKKYPIGVSEESMATFDEVLSVMKSRATSEDADLMANKWRSDASTALTKTKPFQDRKESRKERLSSKLATDLHDWWFDKETLKRHYITLSNKIVHNAIDTHEQMSCSLHEYLFVSPEPPELVRGVLCDESILWSWSLVDIVRWRPSCEETVGLFSCLYPAVYRRGTSNEENFTVKPPVVLVYDQATSKDVPGSIHQPRVQTSLQRSPQRSPRRSPHRSPRQSPRQSLSQSPRQSPRHSPRRSPERHTKDMDHAPVTMPRASTFPRHDDHAAASQDVTKLPPPVPRSSTSEKSTKSERPHGLRRSESAEDNPSFSQRVKRIMTLDRGHGIEASYRSGKSSRESRSKSQAQRYPTSPSSSPSKSIRSTGAESLRKDDPQGRQETQGGSGHSSDNEIIVNEYGATQIVWKARLPPDHRRA